MDRGLEKEFEIGCIITVGYMIKVEKQK